MANNFYYDRFTTHDGITAQTGTSNTLDVQFFVTGSTPKDLTGNSVKMFIIYPDGTFNNITGTITNAVNGMASITIDLTGKTEGMAFVSISTNDRIFETFTIQLQ